MKDLRLFLAFFALVLPLCVSAQEEEEEWLQFQRPECFVEDPSYQGATNTRRIGSQATAPLKSHGVQYIPIVLTAFPDKPFSISDTLELVNEYYNKYCNGTMDGKIYRGHGSTGSIRDYFVAQSDSAFLPEFVIIGPVVLDSLAAYYGKNDGSRDPNYFRYAKEAISKAYVLYDNWSLFDNDKNGNVDMVFFIYAGMGESNGGGEDCIWPKETTSSTTYDGHVFATSAAACELRPIKENGVIVGTKADGIGVFVHELCHALGLPDFYDTNYKAFGMDLWSVMDYGQYANNGYAPGNLTAYERDFMGWRALEVLEEPCVLTIPCFADGGTGYKIVNDKYPNEYYVIENRQPKQWDLAVGKRCSGLQVTHVDFNQSRWNSNSVNTNIHHQRMTIIPANNDYHGTNSATSSANWFKVLAGQLYPGDTFNYNLTDESTPAAQVFSGSDVWVGSLMHKPLRNITENADGTVTVCFCTNGKLDTIAQPVVDGIMMDQFDATWEAVDHATRYAYELSNDTAIIRQDTIADTSIHFSEMLPSSSLKFRVRAMADSPEEYIEGEWSEYCYFETLSDRINSLADGEGKVEVFTLGGMCVSHCKPNEVGRLSLRRGIYVIRYANGSTRKIIL